MNRRKSMIVIAMVALLLTFTVSGTIAWLAASTDPVVNVFTPGQVDTKIDEGEFDGQTKRKIVIKSTENSTIPVYVRVAVSGYWQDAEGNIVKPWNGEEFVMNSTANTDSNDVIPDGGVWFKKGDYYYFSKPIGKNQETTNLLNQAITYTTQNDETLVINVVHQSIQADGTTTDDNDNVVPVVTAKWGVTVASDGTISE